MYTSPYIMTTPIVMPVLLGVVPSCVCRARGARSEGRSAISLVVDVSRNLGVPAERVPRPVSARLMAAIDTRTGIRYTPQ